MKFYTIFALAILSLLLASCNKAELTQNSDIKNNNILETNTEETMDNSFQTQALQDGDKVAVMKTTNGTMTIKLFPVEAPKTVLNFMAHAQSGYYNDLIFHRVINNFMIQGGDPEGTGRGGVSIYGEKFDDEFSDKLRNIPFSLSMANSGPNTNGSQFFINQVNNAHLNDKHSVFGQVVEGMDNVNKIAKTKVGAGDKPVKDIKIISLDIKEYKNGTLKDYKVEQESELAKMKEAQEEAQAIENKAKEAKKQADKNRVVAAGDEIAVHYTGTLENGEKFDSSHDRGETLSFTVAAQMMIKGFDEGVVGMKIGETKTLTIAPADAYGEAEIQLPKDQFTSFVDAGYKLTVGTKLPTQMGEIEILKTDEATITIANTHQLAGKTLTFEVEMVEFNN